MYRLFIVDDEFPTRDGLRNYFDWAKYGIEVIGEADDGEKALEKIMQLKPDIVLTDVKMPKMDGLQLAQQLRENIKDIKIIFISGYDDVDYIKTALKVDAIDYILKPVKFKELQAVIERVVQIVTQEHTQKKNIYNMEKKLLQSLPLLRERFFVALVRGGVESGTGLSEKLSFLDLHFPAEGVFCALMVSMDGYVKQFENESEVDRQCTSFAVLNICQELIERHLSGYIFEDGQGEYVGILNLGSQEYEEKLLSLAREIKDNLMQHLNLSVTIGVGKTVEKLVSIPQSYSMACQAARYRLFAGSNKIITIDALDAGGDRVFKIDLMTWEKITSILKAGDVEKLTEVLDEMFTQLSNSRMVDITYCRNICLQLLLHASRLMMELEISRVEDEFKDNSLMESIFKLDTVEEMKMFISKYYTYICMLITENRDKKSTNVIEKIKEIIHKRYHENITIGDIADEVYLTSTYICLIFKEETGETINDFLTKVRVEKAKELLKDARNKAYDICYAVGYADPSYFSKLFKKYTGVSPSEYRQKVL